MIYSKDRLLWEKLVKITEEVDEFMSSKNKNEFGLDVNKQFYEALKGFKPLKSMRTRRSRISKIKKSKVIERKMNNHVNLNQNSDLNNFIYQSLEQNNSNN